MKRSATIIAALMTCAILGTFGSSTAAKAQSDPNPGTDWNKEYRQSYDVPPGDSYTGRSPYMKSSGQPAPAPAPTKVAAAPAPAPAPKPIVVETPRPASVPCSAITSGPVQAAINMPPQVGFGEEFTYDIVVKATDCVGNVVVTDVVPDGATYVKSDPAAQVDGKRLTWMFPTMEQGESKVLKVTVKADKEGTLVTCATLKADPRLCAATVVGKPMLAIDKTGPETATLGSDITYNIVVSNKGNMVAKSVVVTDTFPDGLTHATGQREIMFQVGDLGPGQSKSIPVVLKATKRGKLCNPAVATSSNAGKVSDEVCTTVLQPGLKVAKSGDAEQFTGRIANYNIVISNTGDVDLANVTVTDTAPAQTSFIAAEGATVASTGQTATWVISLLKAGEQKSAKVQLTSRVAGNLCNKVTVAAMGLQDSAEACTLWKGQPAMLNELRDDPDPIGIGVPTTYTIRITNQGTAPDSNYRVVATFGEQIDPVSASNGGVISGKTVTWPVQPKLGPKEFFEFKLVGKGVKLGDHRLKVTAQSDGVANAVSFEESTQVY